MRLLHDSCAARPGRAPQSTVGGAARGTAEEGRERRVPALTWFAAYPRQHGLADEINEGVTSGAAPISDTGTVCGASCKAVSRPRRLAPCVKR